MKRQFSKSISSLLILVVVLAAAGCSHGYSSHWRGGNDKDHLARVEKHLDILLEDIDASDEQSRLVKDALEPVLKKAKALEGGKDQLRGAYLSQWNSQEVDSEKLNKLIITEMAGYSEFLHDLNVAIAKIHKVLTEEQRKQVFKHVQKHKRL